MIFIVLLCFVFLFLIQFYIQRSYIAPRSLMLISFIMAITIIIANITDWEVRINNKFVIYTFTAYFSFSIGCILVNVLSNKVATNMKKGEMVNAYANKQLVGAYFEKLSIYYPKGLLLLISFVCTIIYVFLILRNSGGISGSIMETITAIYNEAVNGITSNFFLHQMLEIVVAIAKISFFQLMINRYVNQSKVKNGVTLILPIVLFGVCVALSTDRNIFIRFVLYCLCLWILFYTETSEKNIQSTNWKVLKRTLIYLFMFVLVFYGLGKIKSYTSNINRMIGIYGGSGLYNFNLFLEDFSGSNLKYGNSTFSMFQNTLKSIGLLGGNAIKVATHKEFITYRSITGYVYASNVYSAMKCYVEDFGYFGVIIFPFIQGLIFEKIYINARKYKYGFSWVFYSLMMYPLVYFSVTEQFFARFHLGMVYEIGWIAVFYYMIYGKNGMMRRHIVFRLK